MQWIVPSPAIMHYMEVQFMHRWGQTTGGCALLMNTSKHKFDMFLTIIFQIFCILSFIYSHMCLEAHSFFSETVPEPCYMTAFILLQFAVWSNDTNKPLLMLYKPTIVALKRWNLLKHRDVHSLMHNLHPPEILSENQMNHNDMTITMEDNE